MAVKDNSSSTSPCPSPGSLTYAHRPTWPGFSPLCCLLQLPPEGNGGKQKSTGAEQSAELPEPSICLQPAAASRRRQLLSLPERWEVRGRGTVCPARLPKEGLSSQLCLSAAWSPGWASWEPGVLFTSPGAAAAQRATRSSLVFSVYGSSYSAGSKMKFISFVANVVF